MFSVAKDEGLMIEMSTIVSFMVSIAFCLINTVDNTSLSLATLMQLSSYKID